MTTANIEALEFDDVLIKPLPSDVSSRDDVDISVTLSDTVKLKFPLIASPMVGVVDGKFASQLSELGGMAIMHRFYITREDFLADMAHLSNAENFGISVKIGDVFFKEDLDEYNPSVLLVDTANGYTDSLLKYCEEIKTHMYKNSYNTLLMAGNVATYDGARNLRSAGCDLIRVGIGGGSPCSTRNQTGIGIPTLGAINGCVSPLNHYKIVADGGIKNSGDFVKAIVAGADFGMAGKLFAECFEAPNKGKIYGMSSRTHMKNTDTEIKSVEGFDIQITKKQSLEQFIREFGYGIKSAGTYLNASNLDDIYMNAEFIEVTSSAIKKGI